MGKKAMMMPMRKTICIKAYLDIAHNFLITTNTTVEHLQQLIRSEFMLCPYTNFKIMDHNGHRVSLELMLQPASTENGSGMEQYYLCYDRTTPRILMCEPHILLLREPTMKDRPAMLFNPLMPGEKLDPMCATMHLNMPMQVRLRRLPDMDRVYYLLDVQVDTNFGMSSIVHDPKDMWTCNSFRLKMREMSTEGQTRRLMPYAHSPMNDMTEMSMMMDHSVMMSESMVKPVSMMPVGKEDYSKRRLNCVYYPHACRVVEEALMEKGENKQKTKETERELMWNKGRSMSKRAEGGYMEWVMDLEHYSKEHMHGMAKTFVQTFMFECDSQVVEPLHYEFEIVGEMIAQFTGDPASNDEVFEVVQGQPLSCNPGRKRIAAVQCNKICVDVYPGNMALCCYKKGNTDPVMYFGLHGAGFMEQYARVNSGNSGPTNGQKGPKNGPTNGRMGSKNGPTNGHMGPTGKTNGHLLSKVNGHTGPTNGHAGPTNGHAGGSTMRDAILLDAEEPMGMPEMEIKLEETEKGENRETLGKGENRENLEKMGDMPEMEMPTSAHELSHEKGKSPMIARVMQKLRFNADTVNAAEKDNKEKEKEKENKEREKEDKEREMKEKEKEKENEKEKPAAKGSKKKNKKKKGSMQQIPVGGTANA
eukprot:Phypoly_transcript_04306.p1 GENE.Phypoly_transcript_04306~~Phypoly_transcript_04306.p1  ORF type:complete len:646 (+),score=139.61 Phypoly_transcript_04306:181-2118(+)